MKDTDNFEIEQKAKEFLEFLNTTSENLKNILKEWNALDDPVQNFIIAKFIADQKISLLKRPNVLKKLPNGYILTEYNRYKDAIKESTDKKDIKLFEKELKKITDEYEFAPEHLNEYDKEEWYRYKWEIEEIKKSILKGKRVVFKMKELQRLKKELKKIEKS